MISITSAQLTAWVAAFMLPLARVLAVIASAPITGNPSFPLRAKLGLGVMITVLVAPLVSIPETVDPASGIGLLILAQQILIGLVMGIAMQIAFWAAEFAGELIGLQMGLGFATLYDPSIPGFIPVIGQFLGLVVALVFLAIDGHLLVVATLADSFRLLPLAPLSAAGGLRSVVLWGGNLFAYGLALALPLLAALLTTNLALAILTRAAPQLNIFVVGFPLAILVGLTALVLALPYFAPHFERYFLESLQMMLNVVSGLR